MPGPVFRRTADGAVSIRPREAEDAEFYHRNVNDPAVRRLLRNTTPKNRPAIEAEFEEHTESDGEYEGYGFVICREGDEGPAPVGSIGIWRIDHVNAQAWLGAWVDPSFHGEGFAPRGTALVIAFAFDDLDLNRVQSAVFEPNHPSRRVMEKLGFEREGVQREAQHVDGEFVDSYLYGLLRDEWDGETWL